jgi:hypothetical protein
MQPGAGGWAPARPPSGLTVAVLLRQVERAARAEMSIFAMSMVDSTVEGHGVIAGMILYLF